MREIRSPLDGIPSPFAFKYIDSYGVGIYKPKVVADFAGVYSANEYYRTGGSASTFSDMFTYAGASNKTMTDSDGLLKWAPHNLALNSAAPATQSITVVSGADYTVEITGSGSVALSGAGSGTVTAGNPVEITASTTTLTLTVTGTPTTMWAYRSDLGGMVNNPDTGDSYVPTTSSEVYLPRRNHYGWNGSSWVNKGLLLETESRTNLLTYSSEFDNPAWSKSAGVTVTPNTDVAPDGTTAADTVSSSGNQITQSVACSTTTVYTNSVFIKKTSGAMYQPGLYALFSGGTFVIYTVRLNTDTGEVTAVSAGGWSAPAAFSSEDAGDYWRLSVSGNSNNNTTLDFRFYPNLSAGGAAGAGSQILWGAQSEAGSTPSSYMPTTGSTFIRAAESLTIPAAKMAWDASNVSLQMQGEITYADEGTTEQQTFARWHAGATDYIIYDLDTDSTDTGEVNFIQEDATGGAGSVAIDAYTPGTDGKAAYNISGRHLSTAINGATDGTATTEDTTPTALPDLSTTDFQLGYDYMGTIALFREDNNDWGDAGIAEAST